MTMNKSMMTITWSSDIMT